MTAMIDYRTEDETAFGNRDYDSVQGTLIFEPGVKERMIEININDNDDPEPNRDFRVHLSDLRFDAEPIEDCKLHISRNMCKITIIDDDHPGIFSFSQPTYAASDVDSEIALMVKRTQGCDGAVLVKYHCKEGTASDNLDYEPVKGSIEFKHGELEKSIIVPIR